MGTVPVGIPILSLAAYPLLPILQGKDDSSKISILRYPFRTLGDCDCSSTHQHAIYNDTIENIGNPEIFYNHLSSIPLPIAGFLWLQFAPNKVLFVQITLMYEPEVELLVALVFSRGQVVALFF